MSSAATENVYSSTFVSTSQKPKLIAQEQRHSLRQSICYFERLCSMLLPKPACEGCLGHLVIFWSCADSDFPPLASTLHCQHWGEVGRQILAFPLADFHECESDWSPLRLNSLYLCGGLSVGGPVPFLSGLTSFHRSSTYLSKSMSPSVVPSQ